MDEPAATPAGRALIVSEASGAERVVVLDQDSVTIGRDATCDIRIGSPYVSRQHIRIELRDGMPVLVDLGSHNGSEVNGMRVRDPVPLANGDVIRIGDATIRYQTEASAEGTTRTYGTATQAANAGDDTLRVDTRLYEVWLGDQRARRRLSAQEFQLLGYLYERRDRVCLRRELGDAIWGADAWDLNMLHRLIRRLKEKIEPDPDAAEPRYIQTVPQVGYRVIP